VLATLAVKYEIDAVDVKIGFMGARAIRVSVARLGIGIHPGLVCKSALALSFKKIQYTRRRALFDTCDTFPGHLEHHKILYRV